MPRSMWNGALAFGSVTVPVRVFAATDPQSLGMRELHATDGAPVAHRRFDPETEQEVPSQEIVRGAEISAEEWVVLSAEELRSAERPRRKAVEIERFVPDAQIDPIYYGRAYNLAPHQPGGEAYAVLLAALRATQRVGIGRVVLRSRERLVAVRPTSGAAHSASGALRMHTLRFHDELVRGGGVRANTKTRAPSKAEIEMAAALIDTLAGRFEPGRLKDTYRERVLTIARRKAKGEKIGMPKSAKPAPTDDLLEALKASLARSR